MEQLKEKQIKKNVEWVKLKSKKILIFGKGSYIGTKFQEHLKDKKKYEIDVIDSIGEDWKEKDFSKYDVVYHVAGIAHVSSNPKMEELYYKVNRDLPIEVARKAKKEKVKQFIFMSSMIIYGADGKINQKKKIDDKTKKEPIDFYGKSKLEADEEIQKMSNEKFKTALIRTPMVYGPRMQRKFSKIKKIGKNDAYFPRHRK